MADDDLCFPLPDDFDDDDANRGEEYYREQLEKLCEKCWHYYEKHAEAVPSDRVRAVAQGVSSRAGIVKETLYTGALGPCSYVRYRLATSPSFTGDNDAKLKMLIGAFVSTRAVLANEKRKRDEGGRAAHHVSLLNGEYVGGNTMKIVIGNAALRLMLMEHVTSEEMSPQVLKGEIEESMNNLLTLSNKIILSAVLPEHECSVMQGRAGYLKALKFIQTELKDSNFGRNIARKILAEILEEGKDVGGGTFLLWKWKQKIHLGALHGIAGILHTLLEFEEDIKVIDPGAWGLIEGTVQKMDEYCVKSGNLSPLLKSPLPSAPPKKLDKLVQFCTGSPGHALLLTQMYHTCKRREQLDEPTNEEPEEYLLRAQKAADCVILPRGLLKKGVGLCHGISGNGMVFLSIYRAMMSDPELAEDEEECEQWRQYACGYANFALDHLDELENVPDRPYSLYEGLAGLVCLLLGLVEGGRDVNSKFPCYEF